MSGGGEEILCVGLLCLDTVNYCEKYPEEDSDGRCTQVWVLGGNACNNMTVLRQTGSKCKLFTAIADDHTLPVVQQKLKEMKIDSSLCLVRRNQFLPVSGVVVSLQTGSRTITHAPNDLQEPVFEEFAKLDLKPFGLIHFEGRNHAEVRKMIDHVRKTRGNREKPKISVEIEKKKPNIETLIPGADYIFLSKEFAKSRGFPDMTSAVNGVAQKWADEKSIIICAWAELGACARLADGKIVQSPSFPPEKVIDTLAAGDTFVAATISKLNVGKSVEESIRFGCEIAGKKCGIRGLNNLFE